MRLKLLAPFALEGFRLHAARILEAPGAYERAWDDVAAAWRTDASGPTRWQHDENGLVVERVTFTHSTRFGAGGRSRYRTIHAHTLPRPLHAVELVVRPTAEQLIAWLTGARGLLERTEDAAPVALGEVEQSVAVAVGAMDRPPAALVRVHDHGVALFEMDLPVRADHLRAAWERDPAGGVGVQLDALQQLGIALTETVVERVADPVLAGFTDWLQRRVAFSTRFLRTPAPRAAADVDGARSDDGAPAPATAGGPTLWVTRSLILESADEVASTPGRRPSLRHAVAGHWLKDVNDADGVAARCGTDPRASCTSWLNYFFGEAAYDEGYPADGWFGRAVDNHDPQPAVWAGPFSPEWDAMLIAQFYYAAFDRLQTSISQILAISVAGENRRSIATVKAELDGAIRDAHMLNLDFEESRKYYARRVAVKADEILDEWGFEQGVRRQVDRRIEDCSRRLDELHSQGIERSGVYTDLILMAIGVTGVFEALLALAMYGRTMSADPYLQVYDRTSPFNIAAWIGGSSTDVILLAGAFLSLGLVLVYVFVRLSRSKV